MWMNLSHLAWYWGVHWTFNGRAPTKNLFPKVSLCSEIQVWLDGLVCMTGQSFVMWNPCVRVTHLMLTLKVWPSHAWVHMCKARRLRCDTHTLAHTQYSPVICLPHPTYSRSTSSNYRVFVRKSRTRQARSTRGAIKHKSGASGPSPKHLTNALTSFPFLACVLRISRIDTQRSLFCRSLS